MHKLRATYLSALLLGWALSFGAHTSWGYSPPLQASGWYSSSSVTYSVYNPQMQQGYSASHHYLGTVVNFQQHNGVIGWVVQDGADYYFEWVTFDPALNTFQNDWQGPFSTVSHFQVMDGVVAYSFIDSSGKAGCGYATYDPAKGAWQKRSYIPSDPNVIILDVTTKDGVLVFSYSWEIIGITSSTVRADIYDSPLGKWFSQVSSYGPEVIFNDSYLTCQYNITNSTIYMAIYHPVSGLLYNDVMGYDPSIHQWYHGITKPLPFFVPQPPSGPKDLWVWFTDMSIAGVEWNWNFGDNTHSTSRSPYHTFTSAGVFQVSLQLSSSERYSRTITVWETKGRNLPAILSLLLLAD